MQVRAKITKVQSTCRPDHNELSTYLPWLPI